MKLTRTIHPEVRVLDERTGLVEYTASDETLDSYREVIKADGWRFDRFKKNAPFVDSHNYSSISGLLGSVKDFAVKAKQLVETVQWAIEESIDNAVAQLGFRMTVAGHLRAVSVGFEEVRTVSRWDSDIRPFKDACKAVGANPDTCAKIYLQQQQLELSACVIGANPNALARSYRDGILTDQHIERISREHPGFADGVERTLRPGGRVFSFPGQSQQQTKKEDMRMQILRALAPKNETKTAAERVEFARRGQSELELERAVIAWQMAERRERAFQANPSEAILANNSELRFYLDALARYLMGHKVSAGTVEFLKGVQRECQNILRGLDPSTTLGDALFPIPVSTDVVYALAVYMAARVFIRLIPSTKSKLVTATVIPNSVFITPTQTGSNRVIPADTAVSGSNLTPECNTVATRIPFSSEVFEDGGANLAGIMLELYIRSIAARLEYSAMVGNGADDQNNGLITGIFSDTTVPNFQAGAGGVTVQQLSRGDFINTIGTVAPAALQRPEICHWWISSSFIAPLLTLKDGPNAYLLKTQLETPSGNWALCGFDVLFSAQAPSTNGGASKVAVFGSSDAYALAMREDMEMGVSRGSQFANNITEVRALARARADMNVATWLASLKLAAV